MNREKTWIAARTMAKRPRALPAKHLVFYILVFNPKRINILEESSL